MNTADRIPRRSVTTQKVVVLNASYEILTQVPGARAIGYLLLKKAEVIAVQHDWPLRSANGFQMLMPSVVRLVRYVPVPRRAAEPAWTRRGLMARDQHTCAYCGRFGSTVEHIMPVSRGGRSTWLNTVVACSPCNSRKADRTPTEANMPLMTVPTVPSRGSSLFKALTEKDQRVLSELGLSDPGLSDPGLSDPGLTAA